MANHYSLAASLTRINIMSNPKYECNQECKDINHVTWQCKLCDPQRVSLTKNIQIIKLHLPRSIEALIATPNVKE